VIDEDVGDISNLGLSPDGRTMVLATLVRSGVSVVALPDGSPLDTFVGHQSQVHGVTFNATGSVVYTGGADGRLIAWDLGGSKSLGVTTTLPKPALRQNPTLPEGRLVAATADGRLVAAANGDGTVRILAGTEPELPLVRALAIAKPGAQGQPESVAFNHAGRLLAVGTDDGHIFVYDTSSWARRTSLAIRPLPNADPTVVSVAFLPAGGLLAGIADGRVVRFAPSNRILPMIVAATPASRGGAPLAAVSASPDGKLIAAAVSTSSAGHVRVFDTASGTLRYTLPAVGGATTVAFTPDGSLLLTGEGDGLARFWHATDGTPAGASLHADQGTVDSLAVDSTGRTVVAGGSDGAISLFDLATRAQIGTPIGADPATATAGLFIGPGDGLPLEFAVPFTGPAVQLTRWNLRAGYLAARACAVARRNLTPLEWHQVLPNRPYAKVCPRYPLTPGTARAG
jgi:WD40 repeat protein